jgi:TonB-dependent starch-binding outer membrane protein SusC
MKVNILFKLFLFLVSFVFGGNVFAQNASLKGTVKDKEGEPLYSISVFIDGKGKGSITDFDGNYEIKNISPEDVASGALTIVFKGIGYITKTEEITFSVGQTIVKDVILESDALLLEEAVVIGYGTTRTKDLTGSATIISEKDFLKGNVSTPEQLIMGKVAGVKINTNDGAPGSGSTIRMRGGTSINASNDPLIVIDGVPIDNGGIAGVANPLSLINPNDIESFVILKDASATAIYGSRAANGVIIVTTKKGDGASFDKLKVRFDTKHSISTVAKYADVLNGNQFRELINQRGTEQQQALLGDADTDWQREVFRKAYVTDNNVSLTGGIKKLPYRVSFGNRHENGLLRRDDMNRTSFSMNMNPTFFKKHLELEINQKVVQIRQNFGNRGALGAAYFDPTQPVRVGAISDPYGGYYEWLNNNGNPNTLAPKNPVGLINQREDQSTVSRYIANAKLSYKLHFFPQIKAVVNVGTDLSDATGFNLTPATSVSGFFSEGSYSNYAQKKGNKLIEGYLNYNNGDKSKGGHRIDLTTGYSYQDWYTSSPNFPTYNEAQDSIIFPASANPFYTKNALLSFYGRGIYSFKDRYVLTATLRRDGSSRFSPESRWGLFPSIAAAWNITEEKFLKENPIFSYLKLRAGFGVTGQQDGIGDYAYIPNYQQGDITAQYAFGGIFYTALRPDGYDANLKWEETASYNFGLDFGFLNDRISGSVDVYRKVTTDLFATVPVPVGTNFTNQILTNVGSMLNQGIEMSTNVGIIAKSKMRLDLGLNATYNRNEVLKLSQVDDPDSPGIFVGGIAGGIGNTVQVHRVGSPTFTYYVYKQKYDANGNPIEEGAIGPDGNPYTATDAYEDLNGDGIINVEDRYRFEKAAPDWFLGLNLNFTYKKWFVGFSVRSELGGYIYNNIHSNNGTFQAVNGTQGFLNNLTSLYYQNEFTNTTERQLLSDHYLEKANFFRLDYINVGYNFGKLKMLGNKIALNASFTVQNVFVITKYSGLDPELGGGIDNNIYPRPRMYSLNLSFDF